MYGYFTNELYHHGVKGMRWGIRNYQNADGTLTAEGRARYGIDRKNKNYDKSNALGKYLHQRMDYETARAQLNRDVIKSDLKAFRKGGGGLKTVVQNKKAGNEILKQMSKGMDEKYGKNAGKKAAFRYGVSTMIRTTAVLALSGVAMKAAYDKYGSSGKSTTNNAIKNLDLSFVGTHGDRQIVKRVFGEGHYPMENYIKVNKNGITNLMRPPKAKKVH